MQNTGNTKYPEYIYMLKNLVKDGGKKAGLLRTLLIKHIVLGSNTNKQNKEHHP